MGRDGVGFDALPVACVTDRQTDRLHAVQYGMTT